MIDNKYTCYELFNELYKDDRERACNNAYRNESHEDGLLYGSIEDALSFAFSWDLSPEGYDFWEEVYNAISVGTYDQLRADQKAGEYWWHDDETMTDEGLNILKEWAGEATEEKTAPLPTDAAERKTYPIYSGFINYYPNAIAAVSHLSYKGSQQHNPDQPTHWDMSKSGDELDALMRHMIDGDWEQVAWRAMANLERKLTGNCQYVADGIHDNDGYYIL
jgi:hypothetical protein